MTMTDTFGLARLNEQIAERPAPPQLAGWRLTRRPQGSGWNLLVVGTTGTAAQAAMTNADAIVTPAAGGWLVRGVVITDVDGQARPLRIDTTGRTKDIAVRQWMVDAGYRSSSERDL